MNAVNLFYQSDNDSFLQDEKDNILSSARALRFKNAKRLSEAMLNGALYKILNIPTLQINPSNIRKTSNLSSAECNRLPSDRLKAGAYPIALPHDAKTASDPSCEILLVAAKSEPSWDDKIIFTVYEIRWEGDKPIEFIEKGNLAVALKKISDMSVESVGQFAFKATINPGNNEVSDFTFRMIRSQPWQVKETQKVLFTKPDKEKSDTCEKNLLLPDEKSQETSSTYWKGFKTKEGEPLICAFVRVYQNKASNIISSPGSASRPQTIEFYRLSKIDKSTGQNRDLIPIAKMQFNGPLIEDIALANETDNDYKGWVSFKTSKTTYYAPAFLNALQHVGCEIFNNIPENALKTSAGLQSEYYSAAFRLLYLAEQQKTNPDEPAIKILNKCMDMLGTHASNQQSVKG